MLQRIIRLSIWNMFEFTMKQREIKERNGDVEWEGGKGRGAVTGPVSSHTFFLTGNSVARSLRLKLVNMCSR